MRSYLILLCLVVLVATIKADDDFTDKLKSAGDKISQFGKDTWTKTKEGAEDLGSKVRQTFADGFDKLSETIKPKSTADKIKDVFKSD